MKKLIITTLTMLTSGVLCALPIGNPAAPHLLLDGLIWQEQDACEPCLTWHDAWSVRVGFYGDYVFNNYMEIDTNSHATISSTEIYTNAGYLALNFYDRIDLFATLGATDIAITTNASAFNGRNGNTLSFESITDFSWSLGITGILWHCSCTTIGAEAQYFYTRPDLEHLNLASSAIVSPSNTPCKYQEWQVGIALTQRYYYLSPYIGIKWSKATLSFDNLFVPFPQGGSTPTVTLFDLRNQRYWGWVLGVTLINCDLFNVTAEGRFGNQQALYVNGQIRF